jgi:hypothetical protein
VNIFRSVLITTVPFRSNSSVYKYLKYKSYIKKYFMICYVKII